MNTQKHCFGCDRSLDELMLEHNEQTLIFNERFKRNDSVMSDPIEVLDHPETVFTNSGEWYCHTDCQE